MTPEERQGLKKELKKHRDFYYSVVKNENHYREVIVTMRGLIHSLASKHKMHPFDMVAVMTRTLIDYGDEKVGPETARVMMLQLLAAAWEEMEEERLKTQ